MTMLGKKYVCRWLLMVLMMTPLSAAQAHEPAPACGELFPCESPSSYTQPSHVRILRNGQQRAGMHEAGVNCSQFRLTPERVRGYFARAGEVTQNAQQYAGSDSACYAAGTARFKGQTFQWEIGMLREGSLLGSNGHKVYLYCNRCHQQPFRE